MNPALKKLTLILAVVLLFNYVVHAQSSQPLSITPGSPRWALEGQARATEYQGRKCLYLDGGAATLKDLEMRDGVIDVDVATPAYRGFFGIQFRRANWNLNFVTAERIVGARPD